MTSMIKRVSLAILDAGEGCLSGAVYVDPMIAAAAAIKAMREPSDAMMKAGIDAWEKSPMAVATQYSAMIDASLKDNA